MRAQDQKFLEIGIWKRESQLREGQREKCSLRDETRQG